MKRALLTFPWDMKSQGMVVGDGWELRPPGVGGHRSQRPQHRSTQRLAGGGRPAEEDLYVDGAQYWYSLQPDVTPVASDRAASDFSERDADDEVKKRITNQAERGNFTAIQIFAEGPGDVPDDEGVRLVVLAPDATHSGNDHNSPAVHLAGSILRSAMAVPG